jgi:dipeptidyl aminopeptidase/acylaminoacyl peptidase
MTTTPISMDKSGERLFMLDSRERDTAAITSVDLRSGDVELVFASDEADVNGILTHPTEKHIQVVNYTYDRSKHQVLDPGLEADFQYLQSVCDGELEITSQTDDQSHWMVAYATDNGPVKYFHYDRAKCSAKFLFSHRPELNELELSKMQALTIPSRDGLNLVSYLTLPAEHPIPESGLGRPSQPLPMVLLVHGGPWHRDFWGYNPVHQLLANRGYAVLSVNFRGSTGLGKSFINAANMEWGGKMHDDLIDAVKWAVENQIAHPDKIAIMGGSYGGYATLVGLTMTPETFVCGIDIVGPSNLITLMENPPPYWMPIMPLMTTRVGDPSTEDGKEFLLSRSPLTHVDKIQKPLLIGQGANDPRVKQAESDQIVESMNEKNIPVTYVLYPEEGHGFDRPENDISFYAICEAFLAEHLGGRCEDIGTDFEGANFEVQSGADQVPGLSESLNA